MSLKTKETYSVQVEIPTPPTAGIYFVVSQQSGKVRISAWGDHELDVKGVVREFSAALRREIQDL